MKKQENYWSLRKNKQEEQNTIAFYLYYIEKYLFVYSLMGKYNMIILYLD